MLVFGTTSGGIMSRVENRRIDGSLPVGVRLGFHLVPSVRFDLVLFPVPAHRTGQADFPHPALGESSRSRPRKAACPSCKFDKTQHLMQGSNRELLGCLPLQLVLG